MQKLLSRCEVPVALRRLLTARGVMPSQQNMLCEVVRETSVHETEKSRIRLRAGMLRCVSNLDIRSKLVGRRDAPFVTRMARPIVSFLSAIAPGSVTKLTNTEHT